MILCISTES